MRSTSQERRRREPQSHLAPQVYALATSRSSQDSDHLRLHARLKTVVGKMIDFVSITSELLTSVRLPDNSIAAQKHLLEELETEKEHWQQSMTYVLAVQEDVIHRCSRRQLSEQSSTLGNTPSDFKRIADLIAEAQNKITSVLRRKRDDTNLNNKVWEVFTALVQRIYEDFFRVPQHQQPQDDELERLRAKLRALEAKIVETSAMLKSKDLEIQNLQRIQGSRQLASTHLNFTLESDLQHVSDRLQQLEAENKRLRAEFESPHKSLRNLGRMSEEPRVSPRSLAVSVQEVSRLKNEYDSVISEVKELRAWKRTRQCESSLDETDLNTRAARSPECTSQDTPRIFSTPSRPSASPQNFIEDSDAIRVQLNREREKNNSFFSQLQRKEKEVSELQKTSAMLKAEVEHLHEVETEYESKVKRQQEEVSKFLGLIKTLEEDKEQAYALVQQHYRDKLKAERELSVLRIRQSNSSDSEDLLKQLRVLIEEKQQLSRSLSDAQADLTRAIDLTTELQKEKSEMLIAIDTAKTPQGPQMDWREVQTLIGGFSQKMESVLRQTADRVDEIAGRLTRVTKAWPAVIHVLQQQRADESMISQIREEIAELHQDTDHKDIVLNELRSTLRATETQLRTTEAQLRAKETSLEQLVLQQDLSREHMTELKRENNSLSQAVEALKDLQEAVARAEEESKIARKALAVEQEKRAAAEKETLSCRSAVQEMQDRLRDMTDRESRVKNSEMKIATSRERLAALESEVEQLGGRCQELAEELAEANEEISQQKRLVSQMDSEKQRLQGEIEDVRTSFSRTEEQSVAEMKDIISAHQRDYEVLKSQFRDLGNKYESASLELAEKIEGMQRQATELQQNSEELALCKDQIDALRSQTETFRRKSQEAEARKKDAEALLEAQKKAMIANESAKISELTAELKRAERKCHSAEDSLKTAQQESTQLSAQLQRIERERKEELKNAQLQTEEFSRRQTEASQYADKAKKQLTAEKEAVQGRLRAVESECAAVKSDWEAALKSLREKEEEIQHAKAEVEQAKYEVDQLQKVCAQQAAMHKQEKLTVERRKLKSGNLKQQQAGLQEVLKKQEAELTKTTGQLQSFVESLGLSEPFRDDQVTSRISSLQHASEELSQIYQHFGFSPEAQSPVNIFQQVTALESEMKRLSAELAEKQQQAIELENKAKSAGLEVERLSSDNERLSLDLEAAIQQQQSTEQLVTTKEAQLLQLQSDHDRARSQAASALEELQSKVQDLEARLAQQQDLHRSIGSQDEHIHELEEQIRKVTGQIAKEQRAASDLKTANRQLTEEFVGLRKAAEEGNSAQEALQRQVKLLENRVGEKHKALTDASARRAAMENEIKEAKAEREKLRDELKEEQDRAKVQLDRIKEEMQQRQQQLASLVSKEAASLETFFTNSLFQVLGRLETLQSKVKVVSHFSLQQIKSLASKHQSLNSALESVMQFVQASDVSRTQSDLDRRLAQLASRAQGTIQNSLRRVKTAQQKLKSNAKKQKEENDALRATSRTQKNQLASLRYELNTMITDSQSSVNSQFKLLSRIVNELSSRMMRALLRIPELKTKLRRQRKALQEARRISEERATLYQAEFSRLSQELELTQQLHLTQEQPQNHDWQSEAARILEPQLCAHSEQVASLFAVLESRIAQVSAKLPNPDFTRTLQQQVQSLTQQLIGKEQELTLLREGKQSEQSARNEIDRLKDMLTRAKRKIEDLEKSNRSLRTSIPSNLSALSKTFDEAREMMESTLLIAKTNLEEHLARLQKLEPALKRLKPSVGDRKEIKNAMKKCEGIMLRKLRAIASRVNNMEQRKLETPEVELYHFAMEIADQVETLILSRLEMTESRLDRLARTTETVINMQSEEIDHLRLTVTGSRMSEGSLDVIERDIRLSSLSPSLEGVLGTASHFTVCKRTAYQNEVWCLVRVEDEERELYWWREDHLKQLDTRSDYWPAIEEEILQKQLLQAQTQLQDALSDRDQLRGKVESLSQHLEQAGIDMQRHSLSTAVHELLDRAQTERTRPRSPLEPLTFSTPDATVLTEGSVGQHLETIPSREAEFAAFIDTLTRLTEENESQGKVIEDLNRQIELYKETLRRASETPGRRPDKLSATMANLLEMLPEQTSAVEEVVNALFNLMLLTNDQVQEIRAKRAALSNKDDPKKEKSSWLRWKM